MQQEIFFSLAGMKIQKMNMHVSKKRKFEEKVIKKGEQFLNIYRPVNEWHAIELTRAHTHQHQYLFMQATIALAKLYMMS